MYMWRMKNRNGVPVTLVGLYNGCIRNMTRNKHFLIITYFLHSTKTIRCFQTDDRDVLWNHGRNIGLSKHAKYVRTFEL